MKKIYIFVLITFSAMLKTAAQQSGEITPRGIVYPRYTTATRPTGAITPGTTIFNTTVNTHQYYNGSTWISLTNATGGSPWSLTTQAIHNNSGERVGINTSRPAADLEVQGSEGLLVSLPYTITSATPAAAVTMPYIGTLPDITSQAGRILDPGGTGNYLTNTTYQSYVKVAPPGGADAIRFTFEDLEIGSGDDAFVQFNTAPGFSSDSNIMMLTSSSQFPVQKSFIIREPVVYIRFCIPEGSPSARGFQLLYESIKLSPEIKSVNSEFVGRGIAYSTRQGSFATGTSKARGNNSASFGASSAYGSYTIASGSSSANGDYSTALGGFSSAGGDYSTALGGGKANGLYSVAIGSEAISNGNRTMVLSSYSATSNAHDELLAGFKAYKFFTRQNLTTYVSLSEGAASWTGVSDSTKKERHLPVNGENILTKISGLKLTSWNFKNAADRHYGPMAQDFYAAFGKDAYGTIGTDTTINTGDFDGINLIAIQALEKRTQTLQRKNEELLAEVSELKDAIVLLFRKQEELLSKPETDKHDTGSRPK